MAKHTRAELIQWQHMDLNLKVAMTKARIRGWVNEYGTDGVYVAFSGGKDSTVLLDIVRSEYPEVPAVFVDTGLEYPETREFALSFDNVEKVKPKMNFRQVIEKYGYPMISKEVSECVYGAKKYLTSIAEELSLDRQTDRQTDHTCTSITSYADKASIQKLSRGGADNKYRKLRGIGEYSEPRQRKEINTETCPLDGDVDDGQPDDGEYP